MKQNNSKIENASESIKSLVEEMGNGDGLVRQEARRKFVGMGRPAIDYLAELMESPKNVLRWEAIKAMEQIADPISVPLFLNALEDDDADVRWIAAEGLIRLGSDSLKPLLEALVNQSTSKLLRDGAHHVLHYFKEGRNRDDIEALSRALAGEENEERIPLIAEKLLNQIK
jgi:HEAT repeat protein